MESPTSYKDSQVWFEAGEDFYNGEHNNDTREEIADVKTYTIHQRSNVLEKEHFIKMEVYGDEELRNDIVSYLNSTLPK